MLKDALKPVHRESFTHFFRNQLYFRAVLLIIACAMMTLLVFIYWLNYSYDPLVINKLPVPVSKTVVKQGDYQEMVFSYCKSIGNTDHINRYLVTKTVTVIIPPPDQIGNTPKGCRDNVVVPIPISKISEIGEAQIHWVVEYRVNPIRVITEEFDSETFTIVKGD